jgi:hypothetical protein
VGFFKDSLADLRKRIFDYIEEPTRLSERVAETTKQAAGDMSKIMRALRDDLDQDVPAIELVADVDQEVFVDLAQRLVTVVASPAPFHDAPETVVDEHVTHVVQGLALVESSLCALILCEIADDNIELRKAAKKRWRLAAVHGQDILHELPGAEIASPGAEPQEEPPPGGSPARATELRAALVEFFGQLAAEGAALRRAVEALQGRRKPKS